LCRLGEEDEIWLARQMKALIVRMLGENIATASGLFAEALFNLDQTCFALPVVFARAPARVNRR
jgi:hypothetical protein